MGKLASRADQVLHIVRREIPFLPRSPRTATIEITYRCNLRCKTCSVPLKARETGAEELSTEEIERLIGEIAKLGVREVGIIGAEPFLRADLERVVRAVSAAGMRSLITTNAMLLDPEAAAWLVASNLAELFLSLDAPGPENDTIRGGKGQFEKVCEAVRHVVEARQAKGIAQPRVNVHCTVSRLNAGVISGMIPLCEKLGVDRLSYQYLSETPEDVVETTRVNRATVGSTRFIPRGKSLHVGKDELPILVDEIQKIRAYRGRLHVSHRAVTALAPERFLDGVFPVHRCYWLDEHILIDPYGRVHPCAHIDRYFYGSAREKPLVEIWQGPESRKMREVVREALLPVCRFCCHFRANWTPKQVASYGLRGFIE